MAMYLTLLLHSATILHAYFDLFAGFIQTLVFVTLTVVLIGNDIPEEYKDKA